VVGLCGHLVGRRNIAAVLFSRPAAMRHFCAQSSTSHQHFQNEGDESAKRAQDRRSKRKPLDRQGSVSGCLRKQTYSRRGKVTHSGHCVQPHVKGVRTWIGADKFGARHDRRSSKWVHRRIAPWESCAFWTRTLNRGSQPWYLRSALSQHCRHISHLEAGTVPAVHGRICSRS